MPGGKRINANGNFFQQAPHAVEEQAHVVVARSIHAADAAGFQGGVLGTPLPITQGPKPMTSCDCESAPGQLEGIFPIFRRGEEGRLPILLVRNESVNQTEGVAI